MNFSQLGFGFFVLKINGILLALIFCLAVWYYYQELKKEKLDTDYFAHHFWRWIIAGLILGRIFAIFLNLDIFSNYGWMSPFAFWAGGINFYGTVLGSIAMMFYDLKNTEHKPWKWLDLAIPAILVSLTLSDLAEFLTGAVYGTETSLPWGIQYETFGVETIAPIHPVTIYAFIVHFILLNWVWRYGKQFYRQSGKLTIITTMMFFFAEFFLQFFRGDQTTMIFELLRIEQLFSLLILTGLTIYLRKRS